MQKGAIMPQQANITFSSLNIHSCFQDCYIVPEYQREFVWEEKDVEKLLSDLRDAYSGNSNKSYFLGTIVTYLSNGQHELIDGQQRITSFFLLLCVLRRRYQSYGQDTSVFESAICSSMMNQYGESVRVYHLQLQYIDAGNCLQLIYEGKPMPADSSPSIERMFCAVECMETFLAEHYPNKKDLMRFAWFLLNQTQFIRVETDDITDALKIFETINERGVGLNPMDLLKNMIFRQVQRDQFPQLNSQWRTMISALEKAQEKPLRFLRYFIMANYDVSGEPDGILREDRIYDWLSHNNSQCHYEEQPFEFVHKMQENVDRYLDCLRPKDSDYGNIHLKNIPLIAGWSYRQHLMLMLAAADMNPGASEKFKKVLESVVYYTVINRFSSNMTERTFVRWCPMVRGIHSEEELSRFVSATVIPAVNGWKVNHEQLFMNLGFRSMQQYRTKFILAKIFAYVEALQNGKSEVGDLTPYRENSIEIEHIMPQACNCVADYGMTEDEFEIYVNRLGNLTLLEGTINKSIHNDDYDSKCEAYRKSKFYLTRALPELIDQGMNTAINRTNRKLRAWPEWNKASIEERQRMLYVLSEEIWKLEDL